MATVPLAAFARVKRSASANDRSIEKWGGRSGALGMVEAKRPETSECGTVRPP
jgi:hypothetical protein